MKGDGSTICMLRLKYFSLFYNFSVGLLRRRQARTISMYRRSGKLEKIRVCGRTMKKKKEQKLIPRNHHRHQVHRHLQALPGFIFFDLFFRTPSHFDLLYFPRFKASGCKATAVGSRDESVRLPFVMCLFIHLYYLVFLLLIKNQEKKQRIFILTAQDDHSKPIRCRDRSRQAGRSSAWHRRNPSTTPLH